MSRYIENAWLTYAEHIVPATAGRTQIQETRRAFYAGANAFLTILTDKRGPIDHATPTDEPTDADLAAMDDLAEELLAFARAVAEGRA